MELPGHPQVEIWRIRENRQVGFLFPGRGQQLAVLAVDARNVRHHFEQPDYGQAGRVHHGAHAGGPQAGPRTSETLRVRPRAPKLVHDSEA